MTNRSAFKDHFSGHSDAYERYRPDYPPALYAWLAEQSPARKLAVDVATGNGQAAVGLAGHFDAVVGLEPSAEQLRRARRHPRVEYRQEPAEAMSLAAGSADLIVAAQAAHWFDWQAFIAGVRRALVRTGRHPFELLEAPLRAAWGEGPRRVRWPLVLKVHRA